MDESRYASAPLSPAESAVRQPLTAYDGAYGPRTKSRATPWPALTATFQTVAVTVGEQPPSAAALRDRAERRLFASRLSSGHEAISAQIALICASMAQRDPCPKTPLTGESPGSHQIRHPANVDLRSCNADRITAAHRVAGHWRHRRRPAPYYNGPVTSCVKAGTIALTIVAGPFSYFGVNPKISCKTPQPSK
jgi:hypothetical protein